MKAPSLVASLVALTLAQPGRGDSRPSPPPAAHAPAAHPPSTAPAAHPPSTAAADALARILRDNDAFVRTTPAAEFTRIRDEQHPRVTLVACSDSRLQEKTFHSNPVDDLFVVRNIGNQVDSSQGSVAYGVRHLHTPLLLIVGHVACGAVKAAMGDYSAEPSPVRRELDGLHLSIARTHASGELAVSWPKNVVGNVHQQVADAMQEFADEVRSGQLTIVGAVYDFRDEMRHGAGRLAIVDVNGESDPDRIAQTSLMKAARPATP